MFNGKNHIHKLLHNQKGREVANIFTYIPLKNPG